jgi:DNA-3-methyladenine glycosylase
MILPKNFYQDPTVKIAQNLLGTYLVHNSAEGRAIGRIVETEAYLYRDDPACHAHRGMTKRNTVMFGPAGRSYIYFIYGMYYCFNVVTGKVGDGEAVLIRALEPVSGLKLMQARRKTTDIHKLCSGPAKLVLALGISGRQNGMCLRTGPIRIHSRESFPLIDKGERKFEVATTTRIGISQASHLPLRFYIKDNSYVSRV